MECPTCKASIPDNHSFCGICGVALTEQALDLGAFLQEKLPLQIEQAIDDKLSALKDPELVELKATEQVIDRAWKWLTRFAIIVGVPVATFSLIIGYWGVSSTKDLTKLTTAAKSSFGKAVTAANKFEEQAKSEAESFSSQIMALKEQAEKANRSAEQANQTLANSKKNNERYRVSVAVLEGKVEEAAETVDAARKLNDTVHGEFKNIKRSVAAFRRQTQNLEEELRAVSKKVAGVSDLAANIADLATETAAQKDGSKEVKTLSDKVKARLKFDVAFDEKDLDGKIKLYGKAIELDPNYVIAFNNRGVAYKQKGAYDRAIADYDRAIKLHPKNTAAFSNRGLAYEEKGAYDRAIADYDRAIELDPNYVLAFYNRGNAYFKKEAYDRAIADYGKAIDLDPNYVLAFNNRGVAYKEKGAYDRAVADYDRAIELDPESASAFNNKAWLLATADDAQLRNGQEAILLARKAIRLKDSPAYHDTLAAAYAEDKQFKKAILEEELAIEMLRSADRLKKIKDYQAHLDLYRKGKRYHQ
jgi:tetratricopeptide (TPR) repeat protein